MGNMSDDDIFIILIDAWNAGNDIAQDKLRQWVGWENSDSGSLGLLILGRIDEAYGASKSKAA
jgi:hypothetical protein